MTDRSADERTPTRATQVTRERNGEDDTVVRPLTKRMQDKLSGAAEQRRASVTRSSDTGARRSVTGAKPARRARLRLTRIDPWSVMKTSFLLSVAFGIVTVVAVLMVWSVLSAAGVWDSINTAVQDIVGGQDASGFDVETYLGTSRVIGFTLVVAVVDVILITAIATLGAFLYNMAAALLGGIEVTLAEDS